MEEHITILHDSLDGRGDDVEVEGYEEFLALLSSSRPREESRTTLRSITPPTVERGQLRLSFNTQNVDTQTNNHIIMDHDNFDVGNTLGELIIMFVYFSVALLLCKWSKIDFSCDNIVI